MKIKVSDYIIKFLEDSGIDTCFCITGGASAHLFDSLRKSSIKYVCNYHEQACAMSAEGYARVSNKPALVLVTNGPGSSNTLTGVAGAFQDSLPMIVISGQVPLKQTLLSSNATLRQYGVQELDIISMVTSITKYAVQVRSATKIKYILERAFYETTHGRMGPVFLDIPLDIQNSLIEVNELESYTPHVNVNKMNIDISILVDSISKARYPLFVIGNGLHVSKSERLFLEILDKLQIPVAATWAAKDIMDHNNPLYAGNFGIMGERFGNFAIQNADLLIILGSRMSIPCIGYSTELFSPNSYKIMVDIDVEESKKNSIQIDYLFNTDLNQFLGALSEFIYTKGYSLNNKHKDWIEKIQLLKNKYPVFLDEYNYTPTKINSFYFMEKLSPFLNENNIVVTDMGTSFTCTMQSLKTDGLFRLFTSYSLCPMGFGLPGAIGAYYGSKNKSIICICGDGGIQMNIQELQTLIHNKIPIKIFVLNNNGYLAISLMQDNLFEGKYIGSNSSSGVSSPKFSAVASAYGIKSFVVNNQTELNKLLPEILSLNETVLCEIMMVENQKLIPKLQSQRDVSGNFISASLENMFPYLPKEELNEIMIDYKVSQKK